MRSRRERTKQMAVELPARKRRAAQRVASVSRVRPALQTGRAEESPGWDQLSKAAPARLRRTPSSDTPALSTARYTLWLTALALSATLYIGHVHATQQLYESLHAAKKENLRLHLRLDRLKGELDRTAGPAVLHPKARRLGLKEGLGYGPAIHLNE